MDNLKEVLDKIKPRQGELNQPPVNMTELEEGLQTIRETVRAGKSPKANRGMKIPVRYHGKAILNNEQHQVALKALQDGRSLFLTGMPGSGKTHLAIALMGEWMALSLEIIEGRIFGGKGTPHFIPAVELLLEIKASWSDQSDWQIESEKEILDKYSRVTLLVIDDLGAEKISEWSRQVLYLLIDRRYRDMKQTIITSNLTQSELAAQLDDRIASRISEMGVIIGMGETDHRLD